VKRKEMSVFPFSHFRLRKSSLCCDVVGAYVSGFTILIENFDVDVQRISATNVPLGEGVLRFFFGLISAT